MRTPPSFERWQTRLSAAWLRRGMLTWALWPISLVYGALVLLRRTLYHLGLLPADGVGVPLVVIGNVVAGGAGKTPVVMALVQHLRKRGLAVGVISRGYGRESGDCREVMAHSLAKEVGDEPLLIKRSMEVPVFVANRRIDAARRLLVAYPQVQIILSDDGLQHLRLHRALEIGVFDDRGIANGMLLPAGPLREPWPRRLDLVLHTGQRPDTARIAGYRAQRSLASYALQANGRQTALSELAAGGKPLLALAAIAQPEAFFTMLRAQGLTLQGSLALPDHHDFSSFVASEYEDYTLVCTMKDAVKLWQVQPQAWAVPLVFTPEPAFFDAVDSLISACVDRHAPLSSEDGHTTN